MKIDLFDCFDNHLSFDVYDFKILSLGGVLSFAVRRKSSGEFYQIFPFSQFYKILVDGLILKSDDYHLSKEDFASIVSTFHDGLLTFNKKFPCLDNNILISDIETLLDDLYLSISQDNLLGDKPHDRF